MHGADLRVGRQKLRERLSVGVLPRDAQREGLQAAHQQISGQRIDDRPGDRLQRANPIHQLGGPKNGAREQIVVPAEIFRRRVQHEIDTELQRPLVERRCEGGVDESLHAVAPADVGEAFEVDDAVVWIGRRLADEQPRRRANRLLDRLIIARRHYRDFDAVTMQHLGQKLPGAPVRIVRHDHMGIMRKHGVQGRRDRRHAAGEEQAILGAFQRRQFLLGDALGRIAVAPVLLALDASLKVIVQLLGIGESVGRRLNDRRGQSIAELRPRLTAVHGKGAEAERLAVGAGP